MYKKILLPLDGSELAECALSHIKTLFQIGWFREVVLLNVVVVKIPWAALDSGEEQGPVPFDIDALVEPLMDKSCKYLKEIKIFAFIRISF